MMEESYTQQSHKRFETARISAGLSLEQAAKLIGETRAYLRLIELNYATDTAFVETVNHHIPKMADVYGVSVVYLETGKPQTLIDELALWHGFNGEVKNSIIRKWMKKD